MSAVFLKVLNMSITASWLILAVVLARQLLKKAPKRIICLLWLFVALRLICPFSFESILSLIPSSETIPPNISVLPKPVIDSGITIVNETLNPVLSESFTPSPAASVNPLQVVISVAAIVWVIGIAALLIYALISYLKLRKTVYAAVPVSGSIMACDEIKTPFILGVLKPVIYVPSAMTGKTLDYVILHETAHLERHDHWWKPLGFLLMALHWFNPLCWLAYILFCRDIEMACDERIIRDMDKDEIAAYSQALLDCSFPRKKIAACPLAFGEVGLKERVKGILNYKKPAFWIIVLAVIVCVVMLACLLTDPKDSNTATNPYDGTEAFSVTPNTVKDNTIRFELDGTNLIYNFPKNSNKYLTLKVCQLNEQNDWEAFNMTVWEYSGDKALTLYGCINGERPFYAGATALNLTYKFADDRELKVPIELNLKDTSKITYFTKFFNDIELQSDKDILLGYVIITNERQSFDDWTPAVFEKKDKITEDMQVIAVCVRLSSQLTDEIKLPEFYSDTNLHEIVEAYLWNIGEQNAEYKDSKVCSIEEIESITVSKDKVIKSFKVGLMNPENRIHYYYYSVPVADTNASYPAEAFDRMYITVGKTFDSGSIKEFYNQYYSGGDIFKLYFERNYDDLKRQIETAAGHTVNKLSYEGFYPIYEGGCVALSDGNEYYIFSGDGLVSSSFEPFISDYRGSTPCGSVKTAEEAALKICFNLDDVDAAVRFDPYGFFMAKGASNYEYGEGQFFGRNEYYEGKSPNLGADYISGGTKTIYNVFKKDGTYIKTVALKDAGTYRGLRIGDDKSGINELYPEIHTEPHPAIEESREYYWYSKNPETSGSVLIIIVQNDKVFELQSVYVEF